MEIVEIKIKNFRGVQSEKDIIIKDYNLLIGQNDAGKSTVLKSLDLFLNNSEATADVLNDKSTSSELEITLLFKPNSESIIIDENIGTTFEKEELLNSDGLVEIKRIWDVTKSRISPDTFIVRKTYEDDFLLKNEKELMKLCKDNSIDTIKGNNEEYNNVEKREKLRTHYQSINKNYNWSYEKLATSGTGRSKLINDAIKRILPRFEYFKADSSLSESDKSIQKYFKELSIEEIKNYGTDDIEKYVTDKLGVVCDKIAVKINQVVPTSEEVEPVIEFDWKNLITTKFKTKNTESSIPLRLRGDGFRRIAMMAYFEYLAEANNAEKQNIVFGFEEPETFLHPSAQENLFQKLTALVDASYQVIITSHSPVIVSKSDRTKVTHVVKNNGQTNFIQNITDFKSIIDDLGITIDNQFIKEFEKAKLLLLVEGINDAKAFNYVSELYNENNQIAHSLSELGVRSIPLGGKDSIQHWHTLNLLKDLQKPFYIIQDSDKTSETSDSPTRNKLIELGFIENSQFNVLRKRCIENYINPKALIRMIPNIEISYDAFSNVKNISKEHTMNGILGGKNITEKHFCSQTFEEIKKMFTCADNSDEFIFIYNNVVAKL